jgi:nitroreductase
MDLSEIIKTRRTIHNYKTDLVDQKIINEAIHLGLFAPNHKKTFPWHFFSAGPESREKLARLAIELKAQKSGEEISDVQVQAMIKKYTEPSHLLLVAIKRAHEPIQQKEDYASLACAIQNMSLFLWEHNIGAKWSTGGPTMSKKTYELLNISSEQYELCGFLWVGYPLNIPALTERPAVKDIFHPLK